MLSGNRNFEGRVNPLTRANYLASPPLVVAYALAGTMDFDPATEPLGTDAQGKPVFLRDIWPTPAEVNAALKAVTAERFREEYGRVFEGDAHWQRHAGPDGRPLRLGREVDVRQVAAVLRRHDARRRRAVRDVRGARVLALLGDSITTDHISPAGSIKADSPAGRYLVGLGVQPKDFNSYGARRGNHEVMMRGTFANIRLRNLLVPGVEGGVTVHLPSGERMSIYDAAMRYQQEGVPLVVIAGKEYGTGSSRDWAAKGTLLLGVRAVIAESFERIHRSNLVGMGVLPLEFLPRPERGVARAHRPARPTTSTGIAERSEAGEAGHGARHGAGRQGDRVPGTGARRHARRRRVLPPRRPAALRAARVAGGERARSRAIRLLGRRGRSYLRPSGTRLVVPQAGQRTSRASDM